MALEKVLSVRLDRTEAQYLERLAQQEGLTPSEVVRHLIGRASLPGSPPVRDVSREIVNLVRQACQLLQELPNA